ncbi:nitroreductase family protein [Candidatus Omnitrophota bacterium]
MGFLELAKKRKSVRKYSSRSVSREIIDRCLEAARLAPSACNSQPWKFIVIDDEGLKNTIVDSCLSGIYSINRFTKNAPVLIVVITERSSYIASLGGYFKGVRYSLIDIGIACEHLVLQAEEVGLGTCWLGWFDESKVKDILDIPKEKKIDAIISMGYPEAEKKKDKKRKSLEEIRQFNK